METAYRRGHLSTRRRVLLARLKQAWPVLVWLVAVAGGTFLYFRTGHLASIQGVVVTVVEPVAPVQTGRLLSLEVELGERVKAGDRLAVMDASLLDARLAIEEARVIEAEQTVSGFEQGMMRLALDAATERHQAELDLQNARMSHQARLAEAKELRRELARREALLERGLDEAAAVAELRPGVAGLEKEIELFPAAEAIGDERVQGAVRQMEALRSSIEAPDDASVLDAIRERASAQRGVLRASLARRLLEKDSYVLTARRDGIVSRIFAMPGDVVGGGDPILRLVSERSDAVEGFLPEQHVGSLLVGQAVEVRRISGGGGFLGIVTAIAPEIQTLPGRVSPIRNQPIRGRRALVSLSGTHDFIPGETVRVVAR